jgi:hypothetical protein
MAYLNTSCCPDMIGLKIRFMEAGLHRFDGRPFRTSAHLIEAILHQIVGVPTGEQEDQAPQLRAIFRWSNTVPIGVNRT